MDMGDQWLLERLQDIVPASTLAFLHQHVLHPHAPLQVLKRHAVANSQKLLNLLYPLVMPLVDRVLGILQASPDIVVLVFVAVVLLLLWQIVVAITRLLAWWAGFAFRLLLWAAVVGIAAIVYQRGLDATVRDVALLYGWAAGITLYLRDVVLHFWNAYEMQSQVNALRGSGTSKGYGKSRGRRVGR